MYDHTSTLGAPMQHAIYTQKGILSSPPTPLYYILFAPKSQSLTPLALMLQGNAHCTKHKEQSAQVMCYNLSIHSYYTSIVSSLKITKKLI
jgi:hypothetical protein